MMWLDRTAEALDRGCCQVFAALHKGK